MIVPPDILSEVEGEAFPPDSTLGGKLAFEVSPEALKPIDVTATPIAVLTLAVVNEPVDVPLRGNAGVPAPAIGVDGGTLVHPSLDDRLEVPRLDSLNDLRPHLPISAENPEGWLLRCSPTPFCPLSSRFFPLILPLATEVRFVHFDDSSEHLWNIKGQDETSEEERSEELVLGDLDPPLGSCSWSVRGGTLEPRA